MRNWLSRIKFKYQKPWNAMWLGHWLLSWGLMSYTTKGIQVVGFRLYVVDPDRVVRYEKLFGH